MGPIDLNDVALFVKVVDRAGFSKVARDLGVPTSTVSRAVSRLEEAMGAQLLQRSSRSVVPTAAGDAFYRDVSPAVATLHQAARGIDGADRTARGRLRVTAPNDVGATFLAEVATEFSAKFPNVTVETVLTTRQLNLVEEGIDVAVRAAGRLPDSSLVVRRLGDVEADLYVSAAYAARHGLPATLDDLDQHPAVVFRPRDGFGEWRLHDGAREVERRVKARLGSDDFLFVRSAVQAGAGIGLLPRLVAHTEGEALVRVLPEWSMRGTSLWLLHPPMRAVPAKIAAFRDFVADAFARRCRSPAPARPLRKR